MAVVSVKETWRGRRGAAADDPASGVYVRVWRVLTNDPKDGQKTILAAAGIPAYGDAYFDLQANSVDPNVQCFNLTAEHQFDDPRYWMVRAEYTANTAFYAAQQGPEVNWETEYRPRAQLYTYTPIFQQLLPGKTVGSLDVTFEPAEDPNNPGIPLPDKRILNTAGDPFDPAPETPRALKKLVYTRAEVSYDIDQARKYERTLNGDVFWGQSVGSALMLSISATLQNPFSPVQRYWRVRYEILFDEEGHSLKLLNAGYRQLVGGNLQQCRDPVDGSVFARPSLLDQNGVQLAANGNPWYGCFPVYRLLPWAPLNIQRVI